LIVRWIQNELIPLFGNCISRSLLNIIRFAKKFATLNTGLKNMFKSSNDFSLHIEQIVRDKKISYMDAVLQYCKENFIEPEDVAKLVNKSLKDKLEVNFQDENYLPKRAKLDV
jgi:hypothetical protein